MIDVKDNEFANFGEESSRHKRIQATQFSIICYLSEEEIIRKFDMLRPISYAYILHDSDREEDNAHLKKAHYHIYLKFKNKRDINVISRYFNVATNLINVVFGDGKDIIRYMTHIDYPEKYQYQLSSIKTNIAHIELVFNEKNFNEYAFDFMTNYLQHNRVTSITQLIKVMYENKFGGYVDKHIYMIKLIFNDYLDKFKTY